MSHATPRRPFPWALLRHWSARYFPIWLFLAAIAFLVQTVLSYMLHDREDLLNFLKILDRAPKFFKSLIGGDDLMPGNINGVVAIGYQHPLVLAMLMINAVTAPTGLLTGEAERGTMELLLARPVTRGRVYAIACLITMAGQAALVCVVLMGTAVWTRVFDYGTEVSLVPFMRISANLAALSMATAGLAILAASWFSERPKAIAVVVGYIVVTYLVSFAVNLLPTRLGLRRLHSWTLFHYCVPNAVLKAEALPWGNLAVLGAVAAVSVGAGYIIWLRRDIAAA